MLVNEIMELASKEPLKLKIKHIVELTQTMPVKDIAKDFMPFGEKALRDILKSCGCNPQRGKKGWIYDSNNTEVEKELNEFIKPKANKNNSASASNKNSNKNINDVSIKNSNDDNNDNSINESKIDSGKDDKTVSEIKALIQGKNKNDNARIYKGIYFDKDIATFLDHIQHGNKSEIVNKIMRQYLMDNELM